MFEPFFEKNSRGTLAFFSRDYVTNANIVVVTTTTTNALTFEFTAQSSQTHIIVQNNFNGTRDFYVDNVVIEDITAAGYLADVMQSQDYSPFGVVLDGRHFTVGDNYRYSFQGQEHDDEIKGAGNYINFEYRGYDPRVGRFFAVDPLAASFVWNSPYAFSENRVIDGIELEGLEYFPAGKTLITSEASGTGPSQILHIDRLTYIFTKATFINMFNMLTLPQELATVETKKTINEPEITHMLNTANKIRENPTAFKENTQMQPHQDLIEKAVELYGGLTRAQRAGNGVAGLIELANTVLNTINMYQAGSDVASINTALTYYSEAEKLAIYGLTVETIVPKKYIKPYTPNSIPTVPNTNLQVDLINYIMDGTLPTGSDPEYVNMIKEAGTFLFNNREKILNGESPVPAPAAVEEKVKITPTFKAGAELSPTVN